jgi:undecaprenyl-diphosphatase
VRRDEDSGRAGPTVPVGRRVVRPLWAMWTALGGLLLVVVCALVAHGGGVPGWERQVFRAVNELPDWLYRPMWLVQILGLLGVPAVVAVVALLWRTWRLALALLLLVPLKLFVERQVIKELVERGRPGQNEPGAVLRDVPPAGLSFPSGRAIIVFAIAVLVAPYLRGWRRAVPFGLALLACIRGSAAGLRQQRPRPAPAKRPARRADPSIPGRLNGEGLIVARSNLAKKHNVALGTAQCERHRYALTCRAVRGTPDHAATRYDRL